MPRPILVTLLAMSALGVLPSNAAAAPITATQLLSFSLTDTLETAGAATTTLQFDQFDAGLGTLTEVVLSIGVPFVDHTQFELVLHGLGGQARVDLPALILEVAGIPLVPPFPFPATLTNLCSSCSVTSADSVFTGAGAVWVTYPVATQPNLGVPFIGSGILDLMLSAQVSGIAQNATVTGTWSGDVRLDYTYEPAPATVPEPISLLLLGTGAGAVAFRRRQT